MKTLTRLSLETSLLILLNSLRRFSNSNWPEKSHIRYAIGARFDRLQCYCEERERERVRFRHSLSRSMTSSTISTGAKRRRCDSRMSSGLWPFSSLNRLMSNMLLLTPPPLNVRNEKQGFTTLTKRVFLF